MRQGSSSSSSPVPALTGNWDVSHLQGQPSQHRTAEPWGPQETARPRLEPERENREGWGGQEEEAGQDEEDRAGWRGLGRM